MGPLEQRLRPDAPSGDDAQGAFNDSKPKPATWFECVGDDELLAFSRPLLTTFAQPVAIGELVGGPLAGTLVLVRIQPEEPEPAKRPAADPEPALRRTDEVQRTG